MFNGDSLKDDSRNHQVSIADAAILINSGRLVAFPTETVYGLGADATNDSAVAEIYAQKGRPSSNPLIVHIDRYERLGEVVKLGALGDGALRRMKALSNLWPGPLSLVLPKTDQISDTVTNGGTLVAVRIPEHPIALKFLSLCKHPVAAPSANKSNRVSPTCAAHVRDEFGSLLPIIDGGECAIGLESTVVEIRDDGAIIHRPGFITEEQVAELAGPILPKSTQGADETQKSVSPGQGSTHYAPTTPCYTFDNLPPLLKKVAVIGLTDAVHHIGDKIDPSWEVICFKSIPDYAANLYKSLRQIDSKGGFSAIGVIFPPASGLGLAIRDRLSRATHR